MKIKTRQLSLIAIFAALGAVFDSIVTPGFSAGVWFGWIFIISTVAGMVLGPYNGFISTLIAVTIGHYLFPRETAYEFIFTLGAPIGSMISGFMFRGDWKKVFAYYTAMLVFYFVTPISWRLPFWGMWNCYVAYIILITIAALNKFRVINLTKIERRYLLAICTFLGLEADILFRIFILVPCYGYQIFYGLTPEALALIWVAPAPIITPVKVALSILATVTVYPPLIRILEKYGYSKF